MQFPPRKEFRRRWNDLLPSRLLLYEIQQAAPLFLADDYAISCLPVHKFLYSLAEIGLPSGRVAIHLHPVELQGQVLRWSEGADTRVNRL